MENEVSLDELGKIFMAGFLLSSDIINPFKPWYEDKSENIGLPAI